MVIFPFFKNSCKPCYEQQPHHTTIISYIHEHALIKLLNTFNGNVPQMWNYINRSMNVCRFKQIFTSIDLIMITFSDLLNQIHLRLHINTIFYTCKINNQSIFIWFNYNTYAIKFPKEYRHKCISFNILYFLYIAKLMQIQYKSHSSS